MSWSCWCFLASSSCWMEGIGPRDAFGLAARRRSGEKGGSGLGEARHLAEPVEARLRLPLEGGAVDRDQPERRVPVPPLVVVEQAPVQVATHVDAVAHSVA